MPSKSRDLSIACLGGAALGPEQRKYNQLSEAAAAEMKTLHDQHADTSLDAQRLDALADYKRMVEAMSGLDLGAEAFYTADALHQRAQEQIRPMQRRICWRCLRCSLKSSKLTPSTLRAPAPSAFATTTACWPRSWKK